MKQQNPKTAPEVCFVMIDGDYTTESHPHKVSGWLGHALGASLWSPAWSHAHCAGAAEAIMGTVNLKRKVVIITKEELRRIDLGLELDSPKSPGKSKGTKGSRSADREGFAVGNDTDQIGLVTATAVPAVPVAPPLKSILKTPSSAAAVEQDADYREDFD